VYVRLSKRTFELTASIWGQISFMLDFGFLLASKAPAFMSIYWIHAIPFWTQNDSKKTCTLYYSLGIDFLITIARTGFCAWDYLSES